MSNRDELVDAVVEATVTVVTPKSYGLKYDTESKEVDFWLPISQIGTLTINEAFFQTADRGDFIQRCEMPKWLAESKGLEY